MFELYKSEIKRLKFWIILPMLAYLLLNSLSIYFGEYADSGLMIGLVHSILFAVVSLLMGLIQFQKYKKQSLWLYLINRPASLQALCLTLISAAASISLLQFTFTDLLITTVMDNLSPYVIERRHYLQAIYICFTSISFYLAGVYLQLSHSKGGFLAVIIPILAIASLIQAGPSIIISMIAALWMFLLVLSVFKANINNNQTHAWGKTLAAIPFHLGLFLIVGMFLTFSMQMKNLLIDGAGLDIPWNEYFADNTFQHVTYLAGNEKMTLNLQTADQPIQQQYNSQLKIIETVSIPLEIGPLKPAGLLPYQQNIQELTTVDKLNQTRWVFDFDQGLFISQQTHSNEVTKLGIADESGQINRFNSIPTVIKHQGINQVITTHKIYFYDADLKQMIPRVSVPNDETILSAIYQTGSLMGFVSTKNIYLFNAKQVQNSTGILVPSKVIEIPGAHENIASIELAELMDSTLISILFGKNSTTGLFPAEQILIEIDSSSLQDKILAVRPLEHGFSEIYHNLGWIISPLTNWFYHQVIKPTVAADTIKPESTHDVPTYSTKLIIFIGLTTLTALLLTIGCSRHRCQSNIERWIWVTLSCLTGLIGLLVFLLLTDKHNLAKQPEIEVKS